MENYNKFFKYLYFFALYVISFYLMSILDVEWLGILLVIAVYCTCSSLLLIDIINSPKNSDQVVLPLIICILLIFISCIFMLIYMTKIRVTINGRTQWNTRNQVSEARELFVKWKGMMITCVLFIGMIAFNYFILYTDKNGNAEPFFNFTSDIQGVLSGFFIILFIILIPLSIYMLYASITLTKHKYAFLKLDSPTDIQNTSLSFPTQIQGSALNTIFNNINLNYLVNYSVDRGYQK